MQYLLFFRKNIFTIGGLITVIALVALGIVFQNGKLFKGEAGDLNFINCGGTQKPSKVGQPIEVTWEITNVVGYEDEINDPNAIAVAYCFLGAPGNQCDGVKKRTVTYPTGTTNASVQAQIKIIKPPIVPGGDQIKIFLNGDVCSIPLQQSKLAVGINPNVIEVINPPELSPPPVQPVPVLPVSNPSLPPSSFKCFGTPDPATLSNSSGTSVSINWQTNIPPNNAFTYRWTFDDNQQLYGSSVQKAYFASGIKSALFEVWKTDAPGNILSKTCDVVIQQNNADPSPSPSPNPNPSPSPNPNPSPSPSPSPAPIAPTLSSPEILTCDLKKTTVALVGGGNVGIICKLKTSALVNATIIKGQFGGQYPIPADQIVRDLVIDQPIPIAFSAIKNGQGFALPSWNLRDRYDAMVDLGDYSFVVAAQMDSTYKPDISAHKFKVVDKIDLPPVEPEQSTSLTEEISSNTPNPNPPAPVAQSSKCPGVNYPLDINGHWSESFVKAGYDLCLFKGYKDGTFRPDEPITRAESVVMDLSAAGIKPHSACKDAHCGANYQQQIWKDIRAFWQGAWIRSARDNNIVEGYPDFTFKPNALVTRAEAAALISKTKQFNVPPYQGCYTANCGAGHPTNLFEDIFDFWQGSYVRPLWDRQLVQGTSPNIFEPNRPITRAEMAKIVIKARDNEG